MRRQIYLSVSWQAGNPCLPFKRLHALRNGRNLQKPTGLSLARPAITTHSSYDLLDFWMLLGHTGPYRADAFFDTIKRHSCISRGETYMICAHQVRCLTWSRCKEPDIPAPCQNDRPVVICLSKH